VEASLALKHDLISGPIRVDYMPLGALLRAPRNPKSHDIGLIHQSFSRFGYVEPIAINERTGRIVAGHGRLDTLQQKKANGEKPPMREFRRSSEPSQGSRKPLIHYQQIRSQFPARGRAAVYQRHPYLHLDVELRLRNAAGGASRHHTDRSVDPPVPAEG
jgi:hypothetical protein